MPSPTIPISEASHQLLKELAEQTNQTMIDVLDKALEDYRRKVFLDAVSAGYAELRADPGAWAKWQDEIGSIGGCLMDGLDPKERWGPGGDLLPEEK